MIARRQRRKSVQNSDPGKILDLIMSLTDDKCALLQTKINTYLIQECVSEQALLVVVNREHSDAFIETVGSLMLLRKRKISLSDKFKLVMESVGEQTEYLSNMEEDFKSIVEPVLESENPKKRVVMFPIPDNPFSLIVCIVSPTIQEDRVGVIIYEAFLFFWPVLKKSIMLEYERTVKNKCQQLLRVARRLFTQVEKLQTLLHMAMEQAKMLMSAEYCSVMLIDLDQMDLVEIYDPMQLQMTNTETVKRRFKMDVGIAGTVISTGNLVNVKNPEKHPKFNPEIDSYPGITCRSLLCFPIRDQSGIIGVGSLYNKLGDPYFDAMDEEMALAFSVYCGVCIVHSMVYQKMQEAHIRNALANELVMYHMKVGDMEVTRLLECTGFHKHPHFASLSFNVRALPPRELPCYVLKMFSDLGLQKKFSLNAMKLARFVLHVKKGYRDVPYHNWMHAFNVAQWAYAALINYKLVSSGYLNDLQALMYLIACLVHDLDHRGTTNRFQIMGREYHKVLSYHRNKILIGRIRKEAAVLTEFFKQGELEKSRGEPALAFMDRDKCFIPALQQEFLTTTCMPLYSLLAKIIPKAEACTTVLEGHLKQWEAASYVFSEVPISAGLSVLLSPELDNLIEQSVKEREEELAEKARKTEATDED
ncbi:PREDICTED: cGMP-dependent 3',5'-cyclic phosphodiesterase-like [Papilio polytes]|uniref:cGMP-dependent 3',5'-cyclic phosphodiesterase-like n=1 Tax=Papilio polytes TaxID=76194 RepID=UPI00067618FF|nr:PREDICTED: cGMP-dependent 3',5'-cyclic phosphodiesterase-like [Papilio polytes]